MHIQEGTITTLTTCTKMTEEVDRRHGVNGNSSSKGGPDDASVHNSALTATGGRLKFFKDGKFILELVRGSAREGERGGWVSVPRKTFWPPAAPGTPPAPPLAASLSASDDNSSIHSSPWQRDHCWKQPAPRKHLARSLALYYCRPAALQARHIAAATRRKRRRPFDASGHNVPPPRPLTNGLIDAKRNGSGGEDVLDGPSDARELPSDDDRRSSLEREKYHHIKLKKPYQYHKLRVYKKTRTALLPKNLTRTIDKLRERAAALPAPVNAKLANCRQEHAMVSPRKRILRELERVSLEDHGTKRRAKTVPALSTASYPPSPGPGPGPSHVPKPASPRAHNGTARRDPPLTKNASSYSIHSLLSMPDEGAAQAARRSPHSYPASLKTESPCSARSPDLSPSPDHFRYRYESPTPPAPYRALPPAPVPAALSRWPPPQPPVPYRAEELPYVYGYGYAAPLYRAPPPLWVHYAPPGPWAPLPHPHPLLTDHIPKDEPTSDLPLNLSKH